MPGLGLDLYDRYQDVTDWRLVRGAGVRFVVIKATDGAGRAIAPADALVAGARKVGIPAGLYHYAQLTPTPEAQAAVLAGEMRRLGPIQLPPALDLEGDFHPKGTDSALVRAQKVARATDFGRRFLLTLGAAGFGRVMLYANTSFLAQLRPETWGIPGLLIWAADYGPNDGQRHPDLSPYTGPVAVHQYTDRGTIPGVVSGGVDLNWALTDIITMQEDDVSWTDPLSLTAPGNRDYAETHTAAEALGDTFYRVADIAKAMPELLDRLDRIEQRPAADVDEAALAVQLAPLLGDIAHRLSDDVLAKLAVAVADEQARRMAA